MTRVQKKAWEGLVFFLVALAVLLFLPAWTIFYWQGWIYLFVFSACVITITVYLMRKDPQLLQRRLHVGVKAEKKKSQKIIQFIAQFAFISTFLLPALDHHFHWSSIDSVLSIIADGIVIIGFFIVWLVFKENTYTSAIVEVDKQQKVISTGPYAIVRHPMYSGALLMLFATPIALGSWWGVLTWIPMLLIIIWRLLDEESYLMKNLAGYKQYSHRVRWHLLPGIY